MPRTVNRQPNYVTEKSRAFPEQNFVTQVSFGGIREDANDVTVNTNTFEDAKNVYAESGVLMSRPPIKLADGDGVIESGIINDWYKGKYHLRLNRVIVPDTETDGGEYYLLRAMKDGEDVDCVALKIADNHRNTPDYEPKCHVAEIEEKLFIFFAYNSLLVFDSTTGKFGDAQKYIYTPITELLVNDIPSELEAKNIISNKSKRRHEYSAASSVGWDSLAGKTVSVTQGTEKLYDAEMAKSETDNLGKGDKSVVVSKKHPSGGYKYASVETTGATVTIRYTESFDSIYVSYGSELWHTLPPHGINNVRTDPILSKDGQNVIVLGNSNYAVLDLVANTSATDQVTFASSGFVWETYDYNVSRSDYGGDVELGTDTNVAGCFITKDAFFIYRASNVSKNAVAWFYFGDNKQYVALSDKVYQGIAIKVDVVYNVAPASGTTPSKQELHAMVLSSYPYWNGAVGGIGQGSYFYCWHASVANSNKYNYKDTELFTSAGQMLGSELEEKNNNVIAFVSKEGRDDAETFFVWSRKLPFYYGNNYRTLFVGKVAGDGNIDIKQIGWFDNIGKNASYSIKNSLLFIAGESGAIGYVDFVSLFSSSGVDNTRYHGHKYLTGNATSVISSAPLTYVANGFVWSTDLGDDILHIDETVEETAENIVPDYSSALNEYYMAINGSQSVIEVTQTKRNEDSEFMLYLPKTSEQKFFDTITALHPLSDSSIAIFTKDSMWYVQAITNDSGEIYYTRPVKSRIPTGCRSCDYGSPVATYIDGQALIFPSRRGIVAMAPQDFVSTDEKELTYISDGIRSKYKDYYDDAIRVYHTSEQGLYGNAVDVDPMIRVTVYRSWVLFHKYKDKKIWVYDSSTSAWWFFTVPYPIRYLATEDRLHIVMDIELAPDGNSTRNDLVCGGVDFILDESKSLDASKYFDDTIVNALTCDVVDTGVALGSTSTTADPRIDWFVRSQKIHFGAINNYKLVKAINMNMKGEEQDGLDPVPHKAKMMIKAYRNFYHPEEYLTMSVAVNSLRTFVQRMNLMHTVYFQYELEDDDTVLPLPACRQLKLNSVSIKYEAKERIR